MSEDAQVEKQARLSLKRLKPRLQAHFADAAAKRPSEWQAFISRLDANFSRLFGLMLPLYGSQFDFFYYLEELLFLLAQSWLDRPGTLKALDARREADPLWYQSNQMLGGVCYVDLFADNLEGLRGKIPYLKELGLTYLHLMPLFKVPEGENDGGYAVSSYREVNPALGSMEQLIQLASELRQEGISLVLDFVFNHTSDEHEWARKAQSGDPEYRDYYRIFPDRTMPDAYEAHLREIFPDEHPGAFTYRAEAGGWVWTTFHTYQWDLNYANPAVFNSMAQEMLFLANVGVEVLRLDAVAFLWKKLGTGCENLPEAHMLIQAFNTVARIAAPALLFKSEAIVHPDEVVKYIRPDECQLSYNPLVMALLWNSLATRQANLLDLALRERYQINPACAWVNYVRVHDDIGWTFSDEDAARLGINGFDHRQFLNAFFTGQFPGSFARGLPFQHNPKTRDMRISGTCASLAGLEKALREETEAEVELAIRRILLIHGITLTAGGIPLIYLGDEIGTLNDYSYRDDPAKAGDSRWLHRPEFDWEKAARRNQPNQVESRIFCGLRRLIEMRKQVPTLSGGDLLPLDAGTPSVLAFVRVFDNQRVLVFANFAESSVSLSVNLLRVYGLSYDFVDLLSGEELTLQELSMGPCELRVLQAR